jgi:hypothetical protein
MLWMHWITLKYTTNTIKYTMNTPKCIEKHLNTLVSFKIHLSTIKNTFLCFNTHMYTFQNLKYFWHILQYHYYTPISFHIHWNYLETSLFRTFLSCHYIIFQNCPGTSLFYQNVMHFPWHVYRNPKIKHIPWIP